MTDGFRTRDNWSHKAESTVGVRSNPQDSAQTASEPRRTSAEGGASLPHPAAAYDPVVADLEQRIVEAEMAGRRTVADVLARKLEAHRASLAQGNVVPIVAAKARRRGA